MNRFRRFRRRPTVQRISKVGVPMYRTLSRMPYMFRNSIVFAGVKQYVYRYGCGKYNDECEEFDPLALKDSALKTDLHTFLIKVYGGIVYHRVIIDFYNFVISWRSQESDTEMSYLKQAPYTDKTPTPFCQGYYQYSTSAHDEGTYAMVTRVNKTDPPYNFDQIRYSNHKVVYPVASKARGAKRVHYIHYPRVTKAIEAKYSNTPFGDTIGTCLVSAGARDDFCRYRVGWGPITEGELPVLDNHKFALEVDITFEVRVEVDMSYCQRQAFNYLSV